MTNEHFVSRCHECGGTYELVTQPGVFLYRGVAVPVEESFFRCGQCGEERVTWEQAGAKEAAAAAQYREMEKLLSPERIREIRERMLGVSQSAFERALGLGEKTAARWESGRVVQNRATDHLFRLLERDPSALSFLAEHMGTSAILPKPVGSPWRFTAPRRLGERIAAAAEREGIDPDMYATFLLAEGVTLQEIGVKIESIHQTLSSMQREWKRGSFGHEETEPWKQGYEELQREQGYAHAY